MYNLVIIFGVFVFISVCVSLAIFAFKNGKIFVEGFSVSNSNSLLEQKKLLLQREIYSRENPELPGKYTAPITSRQFPFRQSRFFLG